jgi:hypothetical protein
MGGQIDKEFHEIWREATHICSDENLEGLKTFMRDNNLRLNEPVIGKHSESILSMLLRRRISFLAAVLDWYTEENHNFKPERTFLNNDSLHYYIQRDREDSECQECLEWLTQKVGGKQNFYTIPMTKTDNVLEWIKK